MKIDTRSTLICGVALAFVAFAAAFTGCADNEQNPLESAGGTDVAALAELRGEVAALRKEVAALRSQVSAVQAHPVRPSALRGRGSEAVRGEKRTDERPGLRRDEAPGRLTKEERIERREKALERIKARREAREQRRQKEVPPPEAAPTAGEQ